MKHRLLAFSTLCFFLIAASATEAQWVQLNGPSQSHINCFAVKDQNLYAGTELAGVFRSMDNGTTWTQLNSGLTDTTVYEIVVSGPNLFAGTLHGGIFLSTNDGTSWSPVNNGIKTRGALVALFAIDPNAPTTTLFAQTVGTIYRSIDEGASWAKAESGLATATASSFGNIGNTIFTGITGSTVYRSTDDGTTWHSAGSGVTSDVNCFAAIGNDLFAGTASQNVFLSKDSGISWTSMSNGMPSGMGVNAFAVSDTTTASPMLFAANFDGNLYLSRNNGVSWTVASNGISSSGSGFGALAVSGQYIFAETYDGGLWRRPLSDFNNAGVTQTKHQTFSIYVSPNPTHGFVSISGATDKILTVTVTNLLGEPRMELRNPSCPNFTLDLSNLQPGVYYIRLASSNSVMTKKVVRE